MSKIDLTGVEGQHAAAGGIGDLDSTEAGTAARFNVGKPDYSQLSGYIFSEMLNDPWLRKLAYDISQFQMAGDTSKLSEVFNRSLVKEISDRAAPASPPLSPQEFNGIAIGNVPQGSTTPTLLVKQFEFGAEKYKKYNWMKGMPWSAVLASLFRHMMALDKGEYTDPDSNLPHLAAIQWNLAVLLHYTQYYKEGNDLPYKVLSLRKAAE